MRLDLTPITHKPGARMPFDAELDFSSLTFSGETPAAGPVSLRGEVRNAAGALMLRARLEARLALVCDRCARPFEETLLLPIEALLAEELSEEEAEAEIFLLQGGRLDLEELAQTAFVLGMDTKHLCDEACKGLCPRCGADLNEGPCACAPEGDSRFAVLRRLLPADGADGA